MTAGASNEAAASSAATLGQAERAYDAGDFARMRALCTKLVADSDPTVAARARELLARVSVDPLAFAMLLAALVLFGVIVRAYVF